MATIGTAPAPMATMASDGLHSALRLPADLRVVAFVRSAFACVLAREGWPAEVAGRVLLASTEAITNAIEHGSPRGARVAVELSVTCERAEIRVVDEGRPGVPVPAWPTCPPPETSPRGRGLLIIRRLADEMELARAGAGTSLTMCFERPVEVPLARALEGYRAA